MKKIITLLALFCLLLGFAGCQKKEEDPKVIKVACSPTPHAEILEEAKKLLAEKGWTLEIVEFEDYVQPINVVESGEIDANYFAHVP
ncbi:MAG: metal ABC transporter substrate-binding protein, partial [Erysipelotrichaceae bacterium]|nr:metal ABC transporter substrate-binding protein [Erysipelotrichaceae bacterium]